MLHHCGMKMNKLNNHHERVHKNFYSHFFIWPSPPPAPLPLPSRFEWPVNGVPQPLRAHTGQNVCVHFLLRRCQVDVISKMSHSNLVRLLGYCDEADEQILVYEYVSNGNLREHIRNVGREFTPRGRF